MNTHKHKVAFEMLDKSLSRGFPIRPKEILCAWPAKDVSPIMRAYVRSGKATYRTHRSTDWLVPLEPKIDVDGFDFMLDPKNMIALRFAIDRRIFQQGAMIAGLSDGGISAADAKKVTNKLWHLDYVTLNGTSESGDNLFAVTAKGRLLYQASLEYFTPQFTDRSETRDLSRFHSVIDIEVVRDP